MRYFSLQLSSINSQLGGHGRHPPLQLVFRDPSDQGDVRTKPTPDFSKQPILCTVGI
ncbi:hypothetical protein GBAR_LOCUS28232 [Geodia barretti]|uniref:Uncharacterized protein n=1 Tax=Geodia barretti TaxID=519541 RepID=A0AA35XHE3_GEOBA|nr:hypothetical protein GBAR_LOCUS28232 [Geodia barretti]